MEQGWRKGGVLGGWVAVLVAGWGASSACAAEKLSVYASVYKEYITPIEKAFEAQHPEIDVEIFQAGSEKIQAKVEAEIVSKRISADVLLISNPFWAEDLRARGLLGTRAGHPEIETNYYSLMVLLAHRSWPAEKRPKGFADLARPEFKALVQMGNPLESGTNFTTLAAWVDRFGWKFIDDLAKNQIASAGGNSTVIQKVESQEKKMGVALLENILAVKDKGSPVEPIYPVEGGVLIPNVQVMMKASSHSVAAGKFMDYLVSLEGQRLLSRGYLYPVLASAPAPKGARALKDLGPRIEITPELIRKTLPVMKSMKQKFSERVLE